MDFLGDLVGGIFSAASGGSFLGLLGSAAGVYLKSFQAKGEAKERAAEKETDHRHEIELLKLQHEWKAADTENEQEIVGAETSARGMQASIRSDSKSAENAPPWVNAVRALFRPALTVFLIGLMGFMFYKLMEAAGVPNSALVLALGAAVVVDLLTYIVYSTVFSASTSVAWWFGDRAFKPAGQKAG